MTLAFDKDRCTDSRVKHAGRVSHFGCVNGPETEPVASFGVAQDEFLDGSIICRQQQNQTKRISHLKSLMLKVSDLSLYL